jgi:shikimate dehydrogenase
MDKHVDRLYGLIGYPLGHSFSRDFFNRKFEAENIDAAYVNFEIPEIERFTDIIKDYPSLRGLNVSIPYKEQVIHYLDELDDDAAKIGAVNVIKFIRNGEKLTLKGYNSDVIGFRDSIEPILPQGHNHRALVLGTGGASRAVVHALSQLGIESTLVSRSSRPGVITYADLTPEVMASHLIVVNTTPLGMYPHVDECPDIPYELLTPNHLCYDLLYNPDITLFMRKARQNGAHVKNGLEMLLLQAFAAWNIWQKPVVF